jgi:integrase
MKYAVKVGLVPLRPGQVPGDPQPVRIRVSFAGERVDLRVGYSVDADRWNEDLGRMVPGSRNRYGQAAGLINKRIELALGEIDAIFSRFDAIEGRAPSRRELVSLFDRFLGKSTRRPGGGAASFFSVYSRFIEEQAVLHSWSTSHKNRHKTVRNHLQAFAPACRFSDVTKEFLLSFLRYLIKLEIRNTTINKLLSYLRHFLRWSAVEGYYLGDQHVSFRPKLKGSDGSYKTVVYLTWEELMAVYSLEIPPGKNYLARARDVFCFLCFTGLRYSDAFNLSKVDVQRKRIRVVTQKTVAPLYIELNDYSERLLEKYKGMAGDRALPVISNQKMNEYLKEIGLLAGLTEEVRMVYFIGSQRHEVVMPKADLLSTHCGRRTFIVLALRLGIPAAVIMKWTGHRSYAAMRPYVEIVDALKEEEMKKFSAAGSLK